MSKLEPKRLYQIGDRKGNPTGPEIMSDNPKKRAAQYMLQNGLATYAEIAALTGLSRQAVRMQGVRLGAESCREQYLTWMWQKALRLSASPHKPEP